MPKGKPISDEIRARIHELSKTMEQKAVARVLGVSERSVARIKAEPPAEYLPLPRIQTGTRIGKALVLIVTLGNVSRRRLPALKLIEALVILAEGVRFIEHAIDPASRL